MEINVDTLLIVFCGYIFLLYALKIIVMTVFQHIDEECLNKHLSLFNCIVFKCIWQQEVPGGWPLVQLNTSQRRQCLPSYSWVQVGWCSVCWPVIQLVVCQVKRSHGSIRKISNIFTWISDCTFFDILITQGTRYGYLASCRRGTDSFSTCVRYHIKYNTRH